jgi:hypothetical protein
MILRPTLTQYEKQTGTFRTGALRFDKRTTLACQTTGESSVAVETIAPRQLEPNIN